MLYMIFAFITWNLDLYYTSVLLTTTWPRTVIQGSGTPTHELTAFQNLSLALLCSKSSVRVNIFSTRIPESQRRGEER